MLVVAAELMSCWVLQPGSLLEEPLLGVRLGVGLGVGEALDVDEAGGGGRAPASRDAADKLSTRRGCVAGKLGEFDWLVHLLRGQDSSDGKTRTQSSHNQHHVQLQDSPL